jgi:hypothetical protein
LAMRLRWREPFIVFCRVRGRRDLTRELSALIDPNYTYCCIRRQDAVDLGYLEAGLDPRDYEALRPDRVYHFIGTTPRGLDRAIVVSLAEVSLGRYSVREVEAAVLGLDLPTTAPVDMVLGLSFLRHFRVVIDPPSGYVSITPSRRPLPSRLEASPRPHTSP